jgi:hypothetical protein
VASRKAACGEGRSLCFLQRPSFSFILISMNAAPSTARAEIRAAENQRVEAEQDRIEWRLGVDRSGDAASGSGCDVAGHLCDCRDRLALIFIWSRSRFRSWPLLIAAAAWGLAAIYELWFTHRYDPRSKSNIRVDLLMFIALSSVITLVSVAWSIRRR